MSGRRNNIDGETRLIVPDESGSKLSVRRFSIRFLSGDRKGQVVTSTDTELLIGSTAECDLRIENDDTVSRNHCVLSVFEEGFRLEDLSSTNGTWIAGARIEAAVLNSTVEFIVGRSKLEFSVGKDTVSLPLSKKSSFGNLVGESVKMRDSFARMERVAPSDVTVLIEGESGTGKELAARAIHENSARANAPYEIFDCTAVSPNVIESELFGHEKGAFTGAVSRYEGVFERANGGTVFVDEVGELRADLQPKLLRILESGEYRRVGGSQVEKADVRVVAATNRDLRLDVNSGKFRLDLYYRLAGVRITMPSLRVRSEDIPLLVRKFADDYSERHGLSPITGPLSTETVEVLKRHSWPGNVRELRNFVEQSLVLAEMAELPTAEGAPVSQGELSVRTDIPYKEAREQLLDTFCRRYFEVLLGRNKYNISKMAKDAGIDRVYAQRIIKKYELK